MALTPQFLRARALRYQQLAVKVRREAGAEVGDPVAPRLIELAEMLERDAVHDDEKARVLLEVQVIATCCPFPE